MSKKETAADRRAKAARADVEAKERQARVLRRELEYERQLRGVQMRTLIAQFPAIRDLIIALHWLALAADPLQGRDLDPDTPPTQQVGSSREEGAGTRSARSRKAWANRKVGELAERLHASMDSSDERKPEKPRCGRRECKWRDRRQPVEARHCMGCGEPLQTADEEAA